MAARAVVMYAALIVLVRFTKKRFLGTSHGVRVLIGAVAGRATTGGAPYSGTAYFFSSSPCNAKAGLPFQAPSFASILNSRA